MNKRRLSARLALIVLVLAGAVLLLRWGRERMLKSVYPRLYGEIVAAEAAENGLDENLVFAVIRQESSFQPDAVSSAGAVGLMQLMPDTFEWLQKQDGGSVSLSAETLSQPEINVRYGCRLLALLLQHYGTVRTALCAYNAGMSRVDSWLSDEALSSDGQTLSSIPYEETRNYADRVENAYRMYRELYGTNPQS